MVFDKRRILDGLPQSSPAPSVMIPFLLKCQWHQWII